MTDQQIIDLYFARDEQAIRESEIKYGSYCFAAALNILGNQEDAQETVSDTWLRAWNAIPPARPGVLRMFLAKIARNQALELRRRQSAGIRGGGSVDAALEELKECIPGGESPEDALDEKELVNTIRAFLDTQNRRDQNIFIRRYFFLEDAADIAHRYGLRKGTVLTILSRVRQKLKTYLQKEGYAL